MGMERLRDQVEKESRDLSILAAVIDDRVADINAGLDRLVERLEELEAAIPPAEAAE
jgi:hypothetical protein